MMRVDLVRALQHLRQLPRRHRARRTRRDARACALVAKLSIPLLATHARATRAACSESRAETLDRDWRDERRYHADELDTTDQRRRYHRSNAKRPACVFASFREKVIVYGLSLIRNSGLIRSLVQLFFFQKKS
jgi:hypothetical protein